MPVKWSFPVIMESGHHYMVFVEPQLFKNIRGGTQYHDPCDSKCHPVIQSEMKQLSDRLRKGLEK